MIRALYTSSSGMQAQQLNLDAVANNLANVNTAGFKRTRVDFQDLLYQTYRAPGTAGAQGTVIPTGIQVGHGTRPVATQRIFSQGDFQQTENPLDLVIEGNGFFQVLRPDGTTAYSRAGAFKKDGTGRVVTSDGYPLQPGITIPADATAVTIASDGTVSVTVAGQSSAQQVGTLQLARFTNPAGLLSVGRSLFTPTQASGDAVVANPGAEGMGTLGQGFLEQSNVKVVEEMVAMITTQRAYEANAKAIQTADEMLGMSNNLRR
ncbi:MAG TPA: flagellar basal body rod protein FlgG [Elusimicrobia bacterium]|nr:MAG: flagellar basal body rod protein FlgG [Candidatus Rokubacteria bacterium GWA2_70_23]OGK93765.1 MAG: flagellar basal body rod protein FlgG [Candidatus Rokubacteria bacterium GWF2_70_14]HBL18886.1 flagellar basal body rod protein FlgG [Elusimicrobiota bacterium]